MIPTIIFKNNCKILSIIVSTWMYKMNCLSEYIDIEIPPNTTIELKSSTGEWIIGSLFQENKQRNLWKNHGLELNPRIAKFRNNSCATGNYTWNFMDNDFDLVHENGNIIWSYKHET